MQLGGLMNCIIQTANNYECGYFSILNAWLPWISTCGLLHLWLSSCDQGLPKFPRSQQRRWWPEMESQTLANISNSFVWLCNQLIMQITKVFNTEVSCRFCLLLSQFLLRQGTGQGMTIRWGTDSSRWIWELTWSNSNCHSLIYYWL